VNTICLDMVLRLACFVLGWCCIYFFTCVSKYGQRQKIKAIATMHRSIMARRAIASREGPVAGGSVGQLKEAVEMQALAEVGENKTSSSSMSDEGRRLWRKRCEDGGVCLGLEGMMAGRS